MFDSLLDFVFGCLLSYSSLYVLSFVLSQWLLIDLSGNLVVTLLKHMLSLETDLTLLMDLDLLLLLLLILVLTYAMVQLLLVKKSCFLLCLPITVLLSYQWFRHLLWSVIMAHYRYITTDL